MSCNKFRCDKNRVISIAAFGIDAENMYKSCTWFKNKLFNRKC